MIERALIFAAGRGERMRPLTDATPKPLLQAGGKRLIVWNVAAGADTDAEFLKRVLADVRGSGPTALELRYFTEDKDPKKREKLIDTLLKDPAVQKKLDTEFENAE